MILHSNHYSVPEQALGNFPLSLGIRASLTYGTQSELGPGGGGGGGTL